MFLLNVLLAVMWATLTGQFSLVNLVAGFGLGYLVLWLFRPAVRSSGYFRKPVQVVALVLFFLKELVIANIKVAFHVLSPHSSLRPGIVAVPLSVQRDIEIMLLSSLITLTPGSLSLDVSEDRRVLYVHTIDVDDVDAFRADIKQGFERRIQEVFA
jgi:multicomponent Na+:H+ antiporter subunit E